MCPDFTKMHKISKKTGTNMTSWDFKKCHCKRRIVKEIYENYCAKNADNYRYEKYEENISIRSQKVLNLNGAITTSVDDSEITLHRPSERGY